MLSDKLQIALKRLGARLREARLARNELQARFAARIGVSIPTLRRLEQGDATTQIGHWLIALEVLGRLDDVDALLAPGTSLFEAAAVPKNSPAGKAACVIRLDVWLALPEGTTLHAGELACTDADQQGRYTSAFRYTPRYLSDPRAFALDPAGLPLSAGEFQTQQLGSPLMVLEDALPDVWGRRLLILRNHLPRGQQSEPFLLQALAGRGLGALGFYAQGEAPQPDDASADVLELDALADAARRLEQGVEMGDAFRMLLAAGSLPGGARPKVLVRDENAHWMAKFSSRRDDVDMVGLEAASLELARSAGLSVPDFRLAPLAGGRRALLVRRFDLTPQGGRRHMLSLRALLQASGYYVLGYADLIAALRRFGGQPEIDVPGLYRLMAFNALIGNTDDHLKNFWLLHDERGYSLSPAFDLLPDVGGLREHVLMFDLSPHPPGPEGLAALGRKWGVSGATAICEEVQTAVARFREVASNNAVPRNEVDRFAKDIARRLSKRNQQDD